MGQKDVEYLAAYIRNAVSITEAADMLSISRPTMYKYMSCYKDEDYEVIPKHIRDFFDFVLSDNSTSESIREYLETYSPDDADDAENPKELDQDTLRESISSLERKYNELKEEVSQMTTREMEIDNYWDTIQSDPEYDELSWREKTPEEAEMSKEYGYIEYHLPIKQRELEEVRDQIEIRKKILENIRRKELEIMRLRSTANREAGPSWIEGSINTISFGSDGRSMVIFDTDGEILDVTVRIMLANGDKLVKVGNFKPQPGKNYVLIEDLIPKVDFLYKVIIKTNDGVISTKPLPLRFK